MDKPVENEELCTRCGKCCYKKLIIGRRVYITPFPCEYLDTDTNLCTIYDKRHELNPECLSIETGLKYNAFPADCPYVPALAGPKYRPAREDVDWKEEWADFDEFADEMKPTPEMREKIRQRGWDAPPMHVEAYQRIQAEQTVPKLADMVKKSGNGG